MNEVPASREMDLKLPQNLGRQSSEQQFDLAEDERRGRGASQEFWRSDAEVDGRLQRRP
jgi:hypothetical protein